MISRIRKVMAEVSFREHRSMNALVHTDFIIALFLEILMLSNIIIVAQRNDLSNFSSTILLLVHIIRLDFTRQTLPMTLIFVLSFFIFFHFFWCRNRSPYFGFFAKIFPVVSAVLLIQIQAYIHQNIKNQFIILYEFSLPIFFISSIWIIKLTFPQNYMTKHSKLTKIPVLARTLTFIVQILALIFKMNILQFLVFTFVCQIITLIWSLFIFQYIHKDFEYLNFIAKYLSATVSLTYLLQVAQILPQNIFTQYIPFAIFIFLFTSNLLKIIFEKKYSRILKKNDLTPQQIIILYNILLGEKDSKTLGNTTSIFKFTPDKYGQNIMMRRLFHKQNNQRSLEEQEQILLLKRSTAKMARACKKKGEEQANSSLASSFSTNIEYIFNWLQKQQARLQSEFLTIYLCFSYLSQKNYLKSIQSLLKARKMKSNEEKLDCSSIYHLIRLEIQHYKSTCESLNIIVQQQKISQKSCIINRQQRILSYVDCISIQIQLQQLIKKFENLFNIMSTLINKVSNQAFLTHNIQSSIVKTLLLQKIQHKHQIKQMIQKMHLKGHYNTKFIFLNYVYFNICCNQSYTVFQKLQPLLENLINNKTNRYFDKQAMENDMIVMVSIQEEHIGVIQHANVLMKNFFSLNQHKIKTKTEHIQIIIPTFVASQHTELMTKFKRTGRSNFIGKKNKLIVIQNLKIPYQADIDIKIFVLLDGSVSLTSRIVLVKEQNNLILFNSMGQIFENTLTLSMNASLKRRYNKKDLDIFTLLDMNISSHLPKITHQSFTANFQNKLSKIKIESLAIKENQLGICKIKFLNKILLKIGQTETAQKIDKQRKSLPAKQASHKHIQEDIKLVQLQLRISDMKITDNHELFWLRLAFLIFLLISLLIIGYSFNYIDAQFSYSRSIISFYNDIVSGFRVRFLSINSRYILLHAINNNLIPDNITSNYNISSLSKYIKATATQYMESTFDPLDSWFFNYAQIIPTVYLNKFIGALIDYIYPYPIQISWVSTLSLMKSFYHDTLLERSKHFEAAWDNVTNPFNDYLNNQFSVQINSNNRAIVSGSTTDSQNIGNNINGLIYLMGSVLLALIIVILLIMNRINNKTEGCIQLLTDIDDKVWKEQSEKIDLIKGCLQDLTDTMVINYEIQCEFKQLKYYLSSGNLFMRYGQINFQKIKQNGSKPFKGGYKQGYHHHYQNKQILNKNPTEIRRIPMQTKKKFEVSSFIKIHINYISMLILFSLPLFGLFVWSLIISTSNYNSISFFFNYVNAISSFRISQSTLINIAAARLLLPVTPKFNNVDANGTIPSLKTNIFKRRYEDILKTSLSWDITSNYLYQSNCNDTDIICKSIISGTLNENTPSAIMQFSNLNFMLYTNANKIGNTSAGKALLIELWIAYQSYLRPILYQIQKKGLEITKQKLQAAQNQLTFIFQKFILVFMVLFLIIGYWISYRMYKQLYGIKNEMLMSDKVDNLINKVKFCDQFIKLK